MSWSSIENSYALTARPLRPPPFRQQPRDPLPLPDQPLARRSGSGPRRGLSRLRAPGGIFQKGPSRVLEPVLLRGLEDIHRSTLVLRLEAASIHRLCLPAL